MTTAPIPYYNGGTDSSFFSVAGLTAHRVITFPDADIQVPSGAGVGASGTWPISITGTAAGAPPSGAAGGDLDGTYPNPTIAANAVTLAKMATMSSSSFLGRVSASMGNVEVLSTATVASMLNLAAKLDLAGGTMTGPLYLSDDPTSSMQAATKNYVDLGIAGINNFTVNSASTASLTGTYNNGTLGVGATFTLTANGAFTLDGVAGVLGALYLLKDQSSTFQNGIYKLTVLGTVSTPAVLTRAIDYDSPDEITAGDLVNVPFGTVNAGITYMQTATVVTVGTDAITFTRWGGQSMSYQGDVSGSGFSPVTLTIGTNKVIDTMLRQSAGLSIIGRSLNTTGNVSDITAGTDGQVLRRSGTAVDFGALNLAAAAAVTGVLPNANTTANELNFADTLVKRDSLGGFAAGAIACNGITVGGNLNRAITVQTTSSGVANSAKLILDRGDQANGSSYVEYRTAGVTGFSVGMKPASANYSIDVSSVSVFSLTSAGVVNIPGLTASQLVVTNSSKDLVSLAYTALNTASTVVARDGSGNFAAGAATLTGLTLNAVGSASDAGAMCYFESASTSASLLYGIRINKNGSDTVYLGVNKNSVTGGVPSNAVYLSTFTTSGKLSIGRGNGAGLPSTSDILLNGDGSVTMANGGLTTGALTLLAAGSTTDPGILAYFNGASVSAGSMYGIGIQKSGTDLLWMGINKNTVTGSVPANSCYISTFSSTGKLSIGRGGSNGTISTSDILLNGDGTVTMAALAATGIVTTDASNKLATVIAATSYTPTIGDGTNNFTATTSASYYRIGHVYHVQGLISWTSKGSAVAGSALRISLPASIGAASTRMAVTLGFTNGLSFTGSAPLGFGISGNSYFVISGASNAGVMTGITISQCATAGDIIFSCTFWDN